MYIKYIAISTLVLFSATAANAQMYTEVKKPSEQLYELTVPDTKVLKHLKANLKELVTQRLESPEVGAGKKELNYFKADIQKIYTEMNKVVHTFWAKKKKEIISVYTANLTPEELIVYNKYLSAKESKDIEKKRPVINAKVNKLLQEWVEQNLDRRIKTLSEKIIQRQLNVNE
jgi:hypothetical protein